VLIIQILGHWNGVGRFT